MSVPYVGIPDFGFERWDAADIERALRQGGWIYEEEENDAYSWYDPEREKFIHHYLADNELGQTVDKERIFDNFIELAAWIAFYGKDLV